MRGRWPLLIIVLVAIATPLAATALFLLAPPQDTTNRGELLEPVALPAALLPTSAGGATWHLLTIGTPGCGVACQQRLCLLRQVRLVHLGESQRIGRLWLVDGDGATPAALAMEPGCGRELPAAQIDLEAVDILTGVTVERLDAAVLASLPAPASGARRADYLYLVDPQAQVIMRYPGGTPARDIAKDLGRLLRLSKRA